MFTYPVFSANGSVPLPDQVEHWWAFEDDFTDEVGSTPLEVTSIYTGAFYNGHVNRAYQIGSGSGLGATADMSSVLEGDHTMACWAGLFSFNGSSRCLMSAWSPTNNTSYEWGCYRVMANGPDSYEPKLEVHNVGTSGFSTIASSTAVILNDFHLFVVRCNRTEEWIDFWYDGSLVGTVTSIEVGTNTGNGTGVRPYFLTQGVSTYASYGQVDEALLTSGIISDTDVATLWNGGAGITYSDL